MIAFFAAEAKGPAHTELEDYLPQVLVELVACAKHLGYATFGIYAMLFMFCG